MRHTTNLIKGIGLVAAGVAIGVAGIYLGEMDDAPGAALAGILIMIGSIVFVLRKRWLRQ